MPQGDTIRVLLVDDVAEIRRLLRVVLRESSHIEVVGEAQDGEQAIRLTDELRPDIVVMDIEMPRLGGIEATKLITQRRPQTRVIGCTSLAESYARRAMHDAGAAAVVDKSQAFDLLVPVIDATARSESPPVVVLDQEIERDADRSY